ncbi:hemolysin family protein [Rickettsiales endosymbiont of Peranema trichophorum]|uniref:hemolysin family protein n=1 Tax=Rickettsiales endosymbiont of Peranema trichophorum TaxID=2486577 RepID=UPI001A9302BB|nr:hemolysin family protein [Rickettsiales endosymbiont of Peranema trichophorum]
MSILQEFCIILAIIVANSLFVAAEIAIIASRHGRLQHFSKHSGLAKAIQLKQQPELFLSTVQVGMTLMSILIGFYSGTRISETIATYIESISSISQYAKPLSNCIVVVVITYLTVLGEVIPKRLAMVEPEKIAIRVSTLMFYLMKIFYPLVAILTLSTKPILRLMKVQNNTSDITSEEIKHIVNQAEREGLVEKTEKDMIKRLIHLSDIKVGAIMTPRQKVICLDLMNKDEENVKSILNHTFNYFPVVKGGLTNFIGFISVRKILRTQITNQILLDEATRKPSLFIPDSARLTHLLELFREKVVQVAVVLDEYGEIEGIVTLNDILKTFIGDIATTEEGQLPSVLNIKKGGFIVHGGLPIEEVMDLLGVSSLPGDGEEDYRTLASFILKQLNRLANVGDSFEAAGYLFRVIKTDKFRIERVVIEPIRR